MPRRAQRPLLCVSIGCPAGIGPEVAVSAAARFRAAPVLLVGDPDVIARAAKLRGVPARRLQSVQDPSEARALRDRVGVWSGSAPVGAVKPGAPDAAAGAAQLRWIDAATRLVQTGDADALVTGPASKAAIASSGARGARRFTGHTEHIARRLGASEPYMAFHSPALTTSLVTTHLPLARVPRALTDERVAGSCYWLCELLRDLGHRRPRIAVCGLNPHAGENGLLGSEETRIIGPGVSRARKRLGRRAELVGPMGAETAYRLARDGAFDGVVAMYHDQATIAGKLLGFGEMVNVTLGLPIVRTSVDHGTAYDLAGSGKASDEGMFAALALAARLVGQRQS